jgi:4-hydroxybenzoate polyprenyltransferase
MARFRVAVTLLIFFFIGAGTHADVMGHPLAEAFAILALFASYVCATCYNDLADEAVDRVNHPGAPGRPLVSGQASRTDLWQLGLVALLATLALAAPSGAAVVGWMTLSILINLLYSLRPVQLSYRTFAAPLVLAIAYVVIPYGIGVSVAGASLSSADGTLLASLYLLFLARINLKDFRDREGDALYGKPTFLLRFGKASTCSLSLTALGLGTLLMAAWLAHDELRWLLPVLIAYAGVIAALLFRLLRVDGYLDEQACIIVGARLGNGFLTSLLAVLILSATGADLSAQLCSVAIIAFAAFSNLRYVSEPPRAVRLSYRG